jgi:alginate O-acetyltransferase complex protein AlgI
MIFNSITFALFLPIVFILYWFVSKNNLKAQNILLLFASYCFYACWDWRFLFLLIFSTALDYVSGIKINESCNISTKKVWFRASIIINLGFLGIFKYYNFFAESFAEVFNDIGYEINPWALKIILPVGISFYTFHGLSYVIDIYYNRIKAEKNFIDYSVFVSFFPLLVAGPIERATHLLPQIKKARVFNSSNAVDGLRQILWGLFKKVVIADQCAVYANMFFNNSNDYSGSTLLLGALFFTFQIYGDFSGYSDIALGTARLFGINLLRNFAFPYFSRDIAEFWRRWHISLSTWFRDYLYYPLGGSRGGNMQRIRNTFIIFIVSGFWHGANWTFIFWGFLNALYIIPSIILKTNRNNLEIVAKGDFFPSIKDIFNIVTTFFLTVLAWVFFRANNLEHAFSYISKIFSKSLLTIPYFKDGSKAIPIIGLIFILLITEWIGKEGQYGIQFIESKNKVFRWTCYYVILLLIFIFAGNSQQFIYFQF